jgi:predicted dehydrogenase
MSTLLLLAFQIKVGIIGLDTSHVTAFTRILNNPSDANHVPGARVVAGYRGGSPDVESSRTRIDKFTAELETKYKIEIVPDIATLVQKVDAVLLESVDGRKHLEQVRPVLAARKRVFIDKPLASTYADAREIARLGRETGTPWFSSSSLRFSNQAAHFKGLDILGAYTWGPASLEEHHQLDLSWYGIHAIELLYAMMGPGCEWVTRTSSAGADVVTGHWKGGRIGSVRGERQAGGSYGAIAYTPKKTVLSPPEGGAAYAALLAEVVKFFQTGVPPVPNEVTLEIFAFMDAAQRSKEAGGAPVKLLR